MESPAGLPGKPLAQRLRLAAHGGEGVVRRTISGVISRARSGAAELVALEALLPLTDAAAVGVRLRSAIIGASAAGVMVIR